MMKFELTKEQIDDAAEAAMVVRKQIQKCEDQIEELQETLEILNKLDVFAQLIIHRHINER